MASYAVMVVGSLVVSLTDHYIGLLSVLMLFSLYSLAAHGRRRDALIGFGVGVVCFVGLALLDVPDLGTRTSLQSLALLVAAWALGDAIRSRRQQQRDQLDAAVTEERLRIARELHDVVAHSMSLIAVQAGVGAHVIRTDPGPPSTVAGGHRRHQPQGAGADPVDARHAPRADRRRHPAARPGTRRPRRLVDDVRAAGPRGRARQPGHGAGAGRRGLADGVPHRAGVAHQRHQALRGSDGHRHRRSDAPTASTSRWSTPARRGRPRASVGPRAGRPRRAGPAGRRNGGVRHPTAMASGSTPPCRWEPADDPGRGRRRPGPGAGRVRAAAAIGGRHRGRRRGERRAGGDRAVPAYGARRRPDGRADAAPGRAFRDPHDPGRPGVRRALGSSC